MGSMKKLTLVGLTITLSIFSTPVAAQEDMQDVEIRAIPVAGGIYMLTGRGGNIGLSVGEDGAFIVDDQFAPLTEKIQAAIATVTDHSVRFVLNTHWHGDHTGGNENFGKAGAIIVAHENVRKRLNPDEFPEVMGRTQQAPPDALPVVTFTDAVNFHWNGENIRVDHIADAHTDGDAIIYFTNANAVHMGDTYFKGRYPFIDGEAGGGIDGVIAAADHVLMLANSATKIIPGHGELSTPEELQEYRNMLITVRDRLRLMVNEGKSLDQVLAAKITSDLDATWTGDPERMLRGAYQGMVEN